MATALGQAPEIVVVTLADGNVLQLTGNGSVTRMALQVDSGGADLAFAYSGQTDGASPTGSTYGRIAVGTAAEDIEIPPGASVFIWRLSASSTTVRIWTGRRA
jgi:hypothetical protein